MTDLQRKRVLTRSKAKLINGQGRTIVTTRTIGPVEQAMLDATAGVTTVAQMSSDEWCTGPEISDPLFSFFHGPVGVDPCSNDRSIVKAYEKYTEGGLVRPWCRPGYSKRDGGHGDDAYANWPYSANDVWAPKAIKELQQNLAELVILCMTATSTRWWQSLMIEPKRNPRVITTKRLKFIGPSGKPMDSSRFEPALIYYGKRSAAFDREFKHVAMWSTWGR